MESATLSSVEHSTGTWVGINEELVRADGNQEVATHERTGCHGPSEAHVLEHPWHGTARSSNGYGVPGHQRGYGKIHEINGGNGPVDSWETRGS
jgi:hypothetical protein